MPWSLVLPPADPSLDGLSCFPSCSYGFHSVRELPLVPNCLLVSAFSFLDHFFEGSSNSETCIFNSRLSGILCPFMEWLAPSLMVILSIIMRQICIRTINKWGHNQLRRAISKVVWQTNARWTRFSAIHSYSLSIQSSHQAEHFLPTSLQLGSISEVCNVQFKGSFKWYFKANCNANSNVRVFNKTLLLTIPEHFNGRLTKPKEILKSVLRLLPFSIKHLHYLLQLYCNSLFQGICAEYLANEVVSFLLIYPSSFLSG